MKFLQFILLLITPFLSSAEYNGNHIEFNITFKDGYQVHGYNYLSQIHQQDQTISYQEYLQENYDLILKNQFVDGLGEYKYYKDRIQYSYTDFSTDSKLYEVINPVSVDISKIKSLQIIEMIDQSYAIGISTEHTISDSVWMNKKPIEQYSFGGQFCSHNIYIHKKSSTTDDVIKELEILSQQIRMEILELEEELKYANDEDYRQIQKQIETIEEESDDKVYDVLSKFGKEKLVIITMCTC